MTELDPNQATTTNFTNEVDTYSVAAETTDSAEISENFWTFDEATQHLGYYKKIPELKKAIDALAMWTAGKGYKTETTQEEVRLGKIKGWGEDTFESIMQNMIICKKVFGDSFAEIIRNDDGTLINLKPISPERIRIVVDKKGMIIRYDEINTTTNKKKEYRPIETKDMLHLCNDRIADEIHGVSVIEACKWVIDARNEALEVERIVRNRTKALGIAYYDTDDAGTITYANTQIAKAVNKGEMLGLPKDTVEIAEFPNKSTGNNLEWIRYLENFFYQAVGIPKIILGGSEEFTEASSKVGYLTFEQVYAAEQKLLEADIWNQLAIKLTFERPVSLKDNVQNDEAANTGQAGFQPKEASINLERE